MKNTLLLAIGLLMFPVISYAQWTTQVGLNVVPLIARSLELNGEFSNRPAYSLILNAGHTFQTGHVGMIDYNVYDGIHNRKTSGTFVKAGVRLYLTRLNGKERKADFYAGTSLILSQFKQTALRREIDGDRTFTDNYLPVSTKGVTLCPALSIGFTRKIGNRFMLDWGVQKAFVFREHNFIGSERRNYQPGAGSDQATPFMGYLQGVLSLKYRLK